MSFNLYLFAHGLTVPQWVSHVKQELLSHPEHPSSNPVFNGVCFALSSVFFVVFSRPFLTLCPFYYITCLYCFWFTPLKSSNCFCLILTVRRIFSHRKCRRNFSSLWLSIVPCLLGQTVQWNFSPLQLSDGLFLNNVLCFLLEF